MCRALRIMGLASCSKVSIPRETCCDAAAGASARLCAGRSLQNAAMHSIVLYMLFSGSAWNSFEISDLAPRAYGRAIWDVQTITAMGAEY